jgi:hypothetical protein
VKKQLILVLLLSLFSPLFAYSDTDFDGVEDIRDKCPNTPFSELVDINGCTTKSLKSPHNFDIITGISYSDSDYQTFNATDTLATTVQADYYYKTFSLQLSTSYFTTEGSDYSDTGFNDSFIGASYQTLLLESFYIRFGVGAILPTYKTTLKNNTDYTASINLSYTLSNYSLFGGYAYTLINDADSEVLYDDNTTQTFNYQNTNTITLGAGYYAKKNLYLSLSYNNSNSIYTNIEDIQTASFYTYYSIDEHWFSTFSYAYGLSDSASKNYLSLRLGYFF